MDTTNKIILIIFVLAFCPVHNSYSSLPDSLYGIILEDEERINEIASLWDEINFAKNSTKLFFPDWREKTYPAYSFKSKTSSNNWSIGILITRDANEKRIDDLSRFYLRYQSANYNLVVGDYHMNQGLGWTISTQYRWKNSNPFSSEPVTGNLSNEEGRGLRGGAISFKTFEVKNIIDTSIDTWIGFQGYDVRENEAREITFYGEQGIHSRDYDTTTERVLGSALHFSLKTFPARFNLIYLQGDFSSTPAEAQPSRFSNLKKDYSSKGISGSFGNRAGKYFSSFEFSFQDKNAIAGNIYSHWKQTDSSFLFQLYKVTKHFSPIHARPSLAFSGVANGKTGLWANYLHRLTSNVDLETVNRIEVSEPSSENPQKRKFRFDVAGIYAFDTDLKISFRTFTYLCWEQSLLTTEMKAFRSTIMSNRMNHKITVSFEGQNRNRKNGALISIKYNMQPSPFLGIQLSTTYLNEAGENLKLMVIEPTGPGLFPIRMVSGQQLRQAVFLKISSGNGFLFWLRGIVSHQMDVIANSNRQEISLGIEWRRSGN